MAAVTSPSPKLESVIEPIHSLPVRIVACTSLIFIMILGLVGNTLVILSVKRNRKLHNNSNIFVVNLSVVALLTNVLTLPPYIVNSIGGGMVVPAVFCKILGYLNYSLTLVLLVNSMGIAIYRCTLLSKPISNSVSFENNKRIYCAIAMMWIIPMFAALLGINVFGFHLAEMHCAFEVKTDHYWMIFVLLVTPTLISLVSILVCYIFIVMRVRASKRKVLDHSVIKGVKTITASNGNSPQTLSGVSDSVHLQKPLNKSERFHRELKLTLRLVILFTIFCLLWSPLMLSYFLFNFVHIPNILWLISSILARSYTSVNWLLYAFFNKQFCTSYFNILKCRKENQIIPILIQR